MAGCMRLAVGLLALASAQAALAFGLNDVAARAKQLAAKPYQAPPDTLPHELRELRYDQYREIRFKSDQAY
ncbi:glucan biosynthesis protein, partial [Ralstonia pseudosolanacearum]